MNKGIFTISLDFELYWGVRDHRTLEQYGENIRQVHRVIPRLLDLFEKYDVHCTWATVGFLFFQDKKELTENLLAEKPGYAKKEYDPYTYLEKNELDPVYHFAPGLIEKIKHTPGQEIGTHTFSHFYTLEKNTTPGQFKTDLQAAKNIAQKKGVELNSIVFPRNQYTGEHIEICRQSGIKVYRGNLESKAYRPVSREQESLFHRAIRFLDAFINLTGHHCYPLPGGNEIINVPASRFLRPYTPKTKFLEAFKYNRIASGLKFAANHGLIYQLWWHPHNFGKHMEENLSFLERVIRYYRLLAEEGKMESKNLFEIYTRIIQDHEKV